ncbi:MAG TPA: hypothetical protein VFL57_18380, partial [Bryobacteraceae bacterium]|nr:hypothetical protein [Bryobacteraceae bacterium]
MENLTSWDLLEHAYGTASDIPPLLDRIAGAKGAKQRKALEELCARVLHQGSVYSASAPVARALIEMLDTAGGDERAALYGVLSAFAEAARESSCCEASAADVRAIREEILAGGSRFEQELAATDETIRFHVANLVIAFPEAGARAERLAREGYAVEPEAEVRHALLLGLLRVPEPAADWPRFVASALVRETAPENRFLLRFAEICAERERASEEAVGELVSTFVAGSGSFEYMSTTEDSDTARFLSAAGLLGKSRETETIGRALSISTNQMLSLLLAERLLRVVFDDQRTGWGQQSYRLMNADGVQLPARGMIWTLLRLLGTLLLWRLFPSMRKRGFEPGDRGGMRCIEYEGVAGPPPPELPEKLAPAQKRALETIAAHEPLWRIRTNLWKLFGLPESSGELR